MDYVMYSQGKLSKVTPIQKRDFQQLSYLDREAIFIEVQTMANNCEARPWDKRTAYPNWQLGKVRIAGRHGIHRNHVNAIIREFSGKSASSRVSLRLPKPTS